MNILENQQIKNEPIEYLELWGQDNPPPDVDTKNFCPFVGRTCICWDQVECKNPGGRCDGE